MKSMIPRIHQAILLFGLFSIGQASAWSQETNLFELEEQQLRLATEIAAKSVVRIETFAGLERAGRALIATAPTTGLIVSNDGYIVSSAFNFVSQPKSILVTLPDQKRVAAKMVATDHSRQIVLLKVEVESTLDVPDSVPRSEMQVGQWTIAVGKTFDGVGVGGSSVSISVGILSATNRIWGKAIQSDAKISPSNYGGPLVDIHGRVLGVLVPMSPQEKSEVAGAEWYDSGIGFAVPLHEIISKLDQLKQGEDLHPGVMGVALKGSDFAPAEISVSQPKSPAYDAGIRAGDVIVEANDVKIELQSQLKHVLGTLFARDVVRLVVKRDEKELKFNVELTDKLLPYEHPFLGMLPMRGKKDGLHVRYVYPGGPADRAGLMAGDIVQKIADEEVKDANQLREFISGLEVGEHVAVSLKRGETEENISIELGSITVDPVEELPNAFDDSGDFEGEKPATGIVEIKLPEEESSCFAFIPVNYDPRKTYGLVVWLRPPGEFKRDELELAWADDAENHNLIVIAPQAKDKQRWLPTEVDFIRKTIDNVKATYEIDEHRVVTYGDKSGGAMAFMTAAANQKIVRAVIAVDAAYPIVLRPPSNDPVNRLAFYLAWANESPDSRRIESFVKAIKALKFPVVEKSLGKQPRSLTGDEQTELSRWIDSLDRI